MSFLPWSQIVDEQLRGYVFGGDGHLRDGLDVHAGPEQVGHEGVPQGVATYSLAPDARVLHGLPNPVADSFDMNVEQPALTLEFFQNLGQLIVEVDLMPFSLLGVVRVEPDHPGFHVRSAHEPRRMPV